MTESEALGDVSRGGADRPAVLVTGATGFLGGYLTAALVSRGYRVRALSRRASGLEALERLGVEVVRGDLADRASLVRAASGVGLVFHTAGRVSDWGTREAFLAANAEGTQNVVAASQEAVVRPGAIWGPGDPNVVPRIVRLMSRGAMPRVDGGRNLLGLSHVDNLIVGLVLAAEAEAAAGQLYHVTDGEEITAREAIDAIADALGVRKPRLSLPYWAVFGAAALVEGAARALRLSHPPPITRYGVRFVSCHARYDLGKARGELGYEPVVSFREGVAALFR